VTPDRRRHRLVVLLNDAERSELEAAAAAAGEGASTLARRVLFDALGVERRGPLGSRGRAGRRASRVAPGSADPPPRSL